MHKEVKQKFKDLESQLSDPAVISDAKKLKEISYKHAELKYVIELILELEKKQKQEKELEEMIKNESDSEILQIAKNELNQVTEQISKLKNNIEE